MKGRRKKTIQMLAYAWARYMSVGKSQRASLTYWAQTAGCRARFDEMAEEMYEAINNAGLVVRPRETR